MDDIVIRLRAAAESGDMPLGEAFDCMAVAAEIERLRTSYSNTCAHVRGLDKAIEELRKDAQKHLDTIKDLRARIDWLEGFGQQGA